MRRRSVKRVRCTFSLAHVRGGCFQRQPLFVKDASKECLIVRPVKSKHAIFTGRRKTSYLSLSSGAGRDGQGYRAIEPEPVGVPRR